MNFFFLLINQFCVSPCFYHHTPIKFISNTIQKWNNENQWTLTILTCRYLNLCAPAWTTRDYTQIKSLILEKVRLIFFKYVLVTFLLPLKSILCIIHSGIFRVEKVTKFVYENKSRKLVEEKYTCTKFHFDWKKL